MENVINYYIGQNVIIRSYSSGVRFGQIKSYDPMTRHCNIENSRRIFYWRGAFTLNEVATKGISAESKISDFHPELLVTDVIEIIPCNDFVSKQISDMKTYEPK